MPSLRVFDASTHAPRVQEQHDGSGGIRRCRWHRQPPHLRLQGSHPVGELLCLCACDAIESQGAMLPAVRSEKSVSGCPSLMEDSCSQELACPAPPRLSAYLALAHTLLGAAGVPPAFRPSFILPPLDLRTAAPHASPRPRSAVCTDRWTRFCRILAPCFASCCGFDKRTLALAAPTSSCDRYSTLDRLRFLGLGMVYAWRTSPSTGFVTARQGPPAREQQVLDQAVPGKGAPVRPEGMQRAGGGEALSRRCSGVIRG